MLSAGLAQRSPERQLPGRTSALLGSQPKPWPFLALSPVGLSSAQVSTWRGEAPAPPALKPLVCPGKARLDDTPGFQGWGLGWPSGAGSGSSPACACHRGPWALSASLGSHFLPCRGKWVVRLAPSRCPHSQTPGTLQPQEVTTRGLTGQHTLPASLCLGSVATTR